MVEELSLIKFGAMNFWAVLINSRPFQPIVTNLFKLVKSLVESEEEPDKELLDKLDFIYKNTNENLEIPLCIIELAVFRNLDKGLNKEIVIYGKTFTLTRLYEVLDTINMELAGIVVKISKKYSLDMPITNMLRGGGQIDIE
jgi:hypothetical protein